jgi:hypothetical protein
MQNTIFIIIASLFITWTETVSPDQGLLVGISDIKLI